MNKFKPRLSNLLSSIVRRGTCDCSKFEGNQSARFKIKDLTPYVLPLRRCSFALITKCPFIQTSFFKKVSIEDISIGPTRGHYHWATTADVEGLTNSRKSGIMIFEVYVENY